MRIISSSNSNINYLNACLDKSKYDFKNKFKIASYVFKEKIGNLILVYNTVTRFFCELSESELSSLPNLTGEQIFSAGYSALIDNYVLVPSCLDDYTAVENYISKNITHSLPKTEYYQQINSYTIFTTLDCNARCFYCYEHGVGKIKMSEQTAKDTADFIIDHYNGEKINISWFGGEPLYNSEAIDLISDRLTGGNVEFTSSIISNAYLFDTGTIVKAKTKWKLTHAQVTIDGTKDVYNKAKNFIYKDDPDPYSTVIGNVRNMLQNGLRVTVRLNADLYNIENLKDLVRDINCKIGNYPNFSIYVAPLFEDKKQFEHTEQERELLYSKIEDLNMLIHYYGYSSWSLDSIGLHEHFCGADSFKTVTILPNGKIGQCEHIFDKDFIGDIHTPVEEWDYGTAEKIKDESPKQEICRNCLCMRFAYC